MQQAWHILDAATHGRVEVIMTKAWKVSVQVSESPTGSPYYDHYLYLDTSGTMTERQIRMSVYRTLLPQEMFVRPHITMQYLRSGDVLELRVDQIIEISKSTTMLKIGG